MRTIAPVPCDLREGEGIGENAFKALIRAAVFLNASGGMKSTKRKRAF